MDSLSNTLCILGATIMVPYLVKKFDIGMGSYSIIHEAVIKTISWTISALLMFTLDPFYLYIIGFLVVTGVLSYAAYNYMTTKTDDKYAVISLNSCEDKELFRKYINSSSEWDFCSEIVVGNVEYLIRSSRTSGNYNSVSTEIYDQKNIKTNFNDSYLGVQGFYMYKETISETVSKEVTDKYVHTYVEIHILKNNDEPIDLVAVFDKMKEKITKSKVNLKYIRYYGGECTTSIFHNGPKLELAALETKYMSSFFHGERDHLWRNIKHNVMNLSYYKERGQVGRVSMLLYGPPGTGKSTLAYRVAMCLSRSIIGIDLRGMLRKKVYDIMNTDTEKGDYVFVFEEFDITIMELVYQESLIKANVERTRDTVNNIIISTDKGSDPIKTSIDVSKDYTTFRIRDLLELFQGTVPYESMILFATTNKYEEIKAICPELFRPGRLTPVYFGYVSEETLQDISKFYFDREITKRLPSIMTIPTSQIIEVALECSMYENEEDKVNSKNASFEMFESKLLKLLDMM